MFDLERAASQAKRVAEWSLILTLLTVFEDNPSAGTGTVIAFSPGRL
jgi:hypothetical protein